MVNRENPAAAMSHDAIARIFLLKSRRWPGGEAAAPVDQSMQSPVRESFTRTMLGQSLLAVQTFWQRQIFAGRGSPPPVRTSDDYVLAFVQEYRGAIGYVMEETPLPVTVRVLDVTD